MANKVNKQSPVLGWGSSPNVWQATSKPLSETNKTEVKEIPGIISPIQASRPFDIEGDNVPFPGLTLVEDGNVEGTADLIATPKLRETLSQQNRKRSATQAAKLRTANNATRLELDKIPLKKSAPDKAQDSCKTSEKEGSKNNISTPKSDLLNDKDMTTEEIRKKVLDSQFSTQIQPSKFGF